MTLQSPILLLAREEEEEEEEEERKKVSPSSSLSGGGGGREASVIGLVSLSLLLLLSLLTGLLKSWCHAFSCTGSNASVLGAECGTVSVSLVTSFFCCCCWSSSACLWIAGRIFVFSRSTLCVPRHPRSVRTCRHLRRDSTAAKIPRDWRSAVHFSP